MIHDEQLIAHLERGQQVGLLEDDGVRTVDLYGAGVRGDEPGAHGEQRGLTGTGLAHDCGEGIGVGTKGGIIKRRGRRRAVLEGDGGVENIKNGGHFRHFLPMHRGGWLWLRGG